MFINLEQIRCGTANADTILHQKHHKLLSVHKRDGSLVSLLGLLDRPFTEIAGSNYQALLMGTQTAADLLYHW